MKIEALEAVDGVKENVEVGLIPEEPAKPSSRGRGGPAKATKKKGSKKGAWQSELDNFQLDMLVHTIPRMIEGHEWTQREVMIGAKEMMRRYYPDLLCPECCK
jgi:hypothetical protein